MDDKRILFGTAGWSYPDWKGTYYPASRPRGFDDLFEMVDRSCRGLLDHIQEEAGAGS